MVRLTVKRRAPQCVSNKEQDEQCKPVKPIVEFSLYYLFTQAEERKNVMIPKLSYGEREYSVSGDNPPFI